MTNVIGQGLLAKRMGKKRVFAETGAGQHGFASAIIAAQSKTILLMTHVIYGYPTIEQSLELMRALLDLGVDLLEVQYPFSDPVADGPTITEACHVALENTPSFDQYLEDLVNLSENYPASRVLVMSYLNPLIIYGADKLVNTTDGYLHGIIVPDLPLGVGFGVQTAEDVKLLHNVADVAIVGSSLLEAFNTGGTDGLSKLAAQLSHA